MTRAAGGERVYLVSYDIADDSRREKLSRLLQSRGQRVQWSVFEVIATADDIAELVERIAGAAEIFDAAEDNLRCYPLCDRCRGAVAIRGTGRAPTRPGSPLVL